MHESLGFAADFSDPRVVVEAVGSISPDMEFGNGFSSQNNEDFGESTHIASLRTSSYLENAEDDGELVDIETIDEGFSIVDQLVGSKNIANLVKPELISQRHNVLAEPIDTQVVTDSVETETVIESIETEIISEPIETEIITEPIETEIITEPIETEIVTEPIESEIITELIETEVVILPSEFDLSTESIEREISQAPEAEIATESILQEDNMDIAVALQQRADTIMLGNYSLFISPTRLRSGKNRFIPSQNCAQFEVIILLFFH